MSAFTRFVEVGRVAMINYGRAYGSLVVIVDIADQNTVLIAGYKCHRRLLSLKRLSLTDIKLDIPRGAKTPVVLKAFDEAKAEERWGKTGLAKKIAAQRRHHALNDFERYKASELKRQRGRKMAAIISQQMETLRAASKA